MKIALKLITIILIISSCNSSKTISTSNVQSQINQKLVGTWEFEKLESKDGEKIDTIWHSVGGYEIPEGPLIIFKEDGTYSQQFTPKNTDKGKWYFDSNENAIKFILYYEKPYDFAAQYLIDNGHAEKDENGNYFEVITEKIHQISDEKLTLIEREERKRTFKKRN